MKLFIILIFQKELQYFQQLFQHYWWDTQSKMKYSYINYTDYLTNKDPNSFFLLPTEKKEIKLIFSSLDISKANGS